MKRVLFVCLGNICRSPTAEGVFKHLVKKEGLEEKVFIDSAGTCAHHIGENADRRMISHAAKRGYELTSIARQLEKSDFKNFDYIIAMDKSNVENIKSLDPSGDFENKVFKMTDFSVKVQSDEVPDPYFGGAAGFERVLDIVEDSCQGLLDVIKKELNS